MKQIKYRYKGFATRVKYLIAKATSAKQPRINKLRRRKTDIDNELYQIQDGIFKEVIDILDKEIEDGH